MPPNHPIWFVGPTLWTKTAGVERCVRTWVPQLHQAGYNIRVGTFGDNPPPLVEGVPWEHLNPNDIPHLDGLVIANSWVGDAPKTPGIVIHHSVPSLQRLDHQPAGRRSIEEHTDYCAAFGTQLAVSDFTADTVRTRMGLPCDTVTLFAHDAFANYPHRAPTRRPHQVLYASRLVDRKGATLALDAAQLLPNTQFTFINNDPDPDIAALVTKQGHRLMEPVRDPHHMAAVLASHQTLLIPTLLDTEEALGLLSIEAQLVGAHVIATRSGGLPETDCGNLTLTDPTPQALAHHITNTINRPRTPLNPDTKTRWSVPTSVASLAHHLNQWAPPT